MSPKRTLSPDKDRVPSKRVCSVGQGSRRVTVEDVDDVQDAPRDILGVVEEDIIMADVEGSAEGECGADALRTGGGCSTTEQARAADSETALPSSYDDFFGLLHSPAVPAPDMRARRVNSDEVRQASEPFDNTGGARVPDVAGEEMLQGEVVMPGDGCVERMLVRDDMLHVPGVVTDLAAVLRLSRLQQWFSFRCVYRKDGQQRGLPDGVLLSCSSLELLLSASRTWKRDELREIGRAHGLLFAKRATKGDMVRAMTVEHRCSVACAANLYVFESKPRQSGWRFRPHVRRAPQTVADVREEYSPTARAEGSGVKHYGPGIGVQVAGQDNVFPPTMPDTTRHDIIREFQAHMQVENWTWHPCAVCGQKKFASELHTVPAGAVPLELLQNADIPSELWPQSYNFDAYRHAFLCPDALSVRDAVGDMTICGSCHAGLCRGEQPVDAIANYQYYAHEHLPGDIQVAFRTASMAELQLISACRATQMSFVYTAEPTSQKFCRGNVAIIPQDVVQLKKTLPASPADMEHAMCVLFMGTKQKPSMETLKKLHPIIVSKNRVERLVKFLTANNEYYREEGISFSVSNLDALCPEDTFEQGEGIPTSVEICWVRDGNEAGLAATSGVSDSDRRAIPVPDDGLLMDVAGFPSDQQSGMNHRTMKASALQWCKNHRPFLAVRGGSKLFPDRDPRMLTYLFPHLDPWGLGGFHNPRRQEKQRISFERQLRNLLLRYDVTLFEGDANFAYVGWNIVQKLEASQSMAFRVGQSEYHNICKEIESYATTFETMNAKWKANVHAQPSMCEEKRALRVLDKLKLLARNLRGSNGRRLQMRNEIRALLKNNGCPTLFLTLNPADLYSKLLHVLAGGNAEDFLGLSAFDRAKQVAQHPAAAAQFFDMMIKAFVDKILRHGDPRPGLFGHCDAYYGTVEAQGRGTLHCHMLVWIRGNLSPQALRDKLVDDDGYRASVFGWLESVIRCELPDMTRMLVSTARDPVMKPEMNKATDPRLMDGPVLPERMADDDRELFEANFREFVKELAITCNWHQHTDTSWKHLRPHDPRDDAHCRMRIDGSTRAITELDPDTASILLRRLHPWINNFNDVVLFLMRCNMDIKFIGSGEAAKALVFYITDYITKASLATHLGLDALCVAIRKNEVKFSKRAGVSLDTVRKSLLTKIVNAMMARQEMSHQQVMSYLVGGGDCYTSHCFRPLYFGQLDRYLLMRECETAGVSAEGDVGRARDEDPYTYAAVADDHAQCSNDDADVTMTISPSGVSMSSLLVDYRYRGRSDMFEDLTVWDHVTWVERLTRSEEARRLQRRHEHRRQEDRGPLHCVDGQRRRPGAKAADRVEYSDVKHPLFATHLSRMRRKPVVPVYLGKAIPHRAGAEEEYCRAMLILFKPWRDIQDLKGDSITWTAAFDSYTFPAHLLSIMHNMHIERECRDAKQQSMDLMRAGMLNGIPIVNDAYVRNTEVAIEDLEDCLLNERGLDNDDSDDGRLRTTGNSQTLAEADRISQGLDILQRSQLVDDAASSCVNTDVCSEPEKSWDLSSEDLEHLRSYMAHQKLKKRPVSSTVPPPSKKGKTHRSAIFNPQVTVESIQNAVKRNSAPTQDEESDVCDASETLDRILSESGIVGNAEQEMAIRIIAEHFFTNDPEQLLMYISGVGGTGKSHVVRAVVELFARRGAASNLLLSAPTGIAGVLIGGYTLHALAFLPEMYFKGREDELINIWKDVKYLIIDEVSMVSPQLLKKVSSRIAKAKAWQCGQADLPFGGVNIIFCGDFGQLRPPKSKSLFAHDLVSPSNKKKGQKEDSQDALQGVHLWRQVNTVVHLTKNWRHAKDKAYSDLLGRIRGGAGTVRRDGRGVSDYEVLSGRVLNLLRTRESLQKFKDSPIITVDKKFRDALNIRIAQSRARETGVGISYYASDDYYLSDRLHGDAARRARRLPSNVTNDMLGVLPLFPGMPVMVTDNADMTHGIVNGMEGTVKQVDYTHNDDGDRITSCVYVHVPKCGMHCNGLPMDVVPVFPMKTTITYAGENKRTYSIKRFQVPLLPSYAYIDYKSQGRSLQSAIVDVASCKTQQSAYVMLSRVTSLEGLAILRWFPPMTIARGLQHDMRTELARLDALAQKTTDAYHRRVGI